MATLYVENVPEELYESLKAQARQHRRSIAQETIVLLERHMVPASELERRRLILDRALAMRSRPSLLTSDAPVESAEQMLAEDRAR